MAGISRVTVPAGLRATRHPGVEDVALPQRPEKRRVPCAHARLNTRRQVGWEVRNEPGSGWNSVIRLMARRAPGVIVEVPPAAGLVVRTTPASARSSSMPVHGGEALPTTAVG
ncbi:hypothetical protein GCM10022399_42900 [Terrabacter ginsenosidimutans]|uniref:Uncharacterized protein n=1 Tax=Terrabacter ginsenosidimutans TaxID=490575 RepID=A0ABP7ENX3_9MICO